MKFVYCVQTEENLPQHYSEVRDRCIVLSWKKHGEDTTLCVPNSTWNTGRNALIKFLRESEIEYDYVIFLDDDLKFKKGNFVEFENVVRKHPEWVVSTVSDDFDRDTNYPYRFMNSQANHTVWQIVPQFDACFSCFRKDFVDSDKFLPYDESWDHITWWASQIVLCQKMNAMCIPIHYVNNISVSNSKSRPYPRNEEIIRNIAFEINKKVNESYSTNILNYYDVIKHWDFKGGD